MGKYQFISKSCRSLPTVSEANLKVITTTIRNVDLQIINNLVLVVLFLYVMLTLY